LLGRIGHFIKNNNQDVDIIGYTDNVPIDVKNKMSNRELSGMRALNVLKHFTSHSGISPERLTAFGWGKYKPIVANTTRESRAMNRRVEVAFIHKRDKEKSKGAFTFKNFFFEL